MLSFVTLPDSNWSSGSRTSARRLPKGYQRWLTSHFLMWQAAYGDHGDSADNGWDTRPEECSGVGATLRKVQVLG